MVYGSCKAHHGEGLNLWDTHIQFTSARNTARYYVGCTRYLVSSPTPQCLVWLWAFGSMIVTHRNCREWRLRFALLLENIVGVVLCVYNISDFLISVPDGSSS